MTGPVSTMPRNSAPVPAARRWSLGCRAAARAAAPAAIQRMHSVDAPVPDAAGGARGKQSVPREADLLGQFAPRRHFWCLAAPDSAALGSSTRSDMTNAPTAAPDRREPLPAHPHAAGAALATKFGPAGNQFDTLFARRRCESWKVEHAQGLAWADLYLPLPVRGTDSVALSRSARGFSPEHAPSAGRHGEQRRLRGSRSGRSSPRATKSGNVKAYRPSMLMCLSPRGES